ncbi:hypothetical protein M514_17695 [Trichuris suis]|uniref:Mariner Mos1 transposase n=1 Tax=Trichuris suis TaxID=68888 RepID=A0A085NKU7_9BILA|nr:hypothetical protein M514_17695 [Trichuris suis]
MDSGQATTSTPKANIYGKKVLLCVWWDRHGVLYRELLKPGQTVTADVYCSQLRKLSQILREKRQKYAHNQGLVLLLHDNARRHVDSVTKNTIHRLDRRELLYVADSHDLPPSDYHLFRSIKHGLTRQHFKEFEDVKKWVVRFFGSKPLTETRLTLYMDPTVSKDLSLQIIEITSK